MNFSVLCISIFLGEGPFKMSGGDEEALFQLIGAAYNELTEVLNQVVSKHALEHPNAGFTSDPEIALANILAKDVAQVRAIKSTSYGDNLDLIFIPKTNRKKLLRTIQISKLDCSLLLDILLQFPGFIQANCNGTACPHITNSCCSACDHSPPSCKNKKCKTKCNHKCKNQKCSLLKDRCKEYTTLCNGNCSICFECNLDYFENTVTRTLQNPNSPEPCGSFSYWHCLNIMLKFRNLYGHLSHEKCRDFLLKKKSMNLLNSTFNGEEELLKYLKKIFWFILDYVPLEDAKRIKFKENLNSIFTKGESLRQYIVQSFKFIEKRSIVLQNLLPSSQLKELTSLWGKFETELLDGIESSNKEQAHNIIAANDASNKQQTEKILDGVKELIKTTNKDNKATDKSK